MNNYNLTATAPVFAQYASNTTDNYTITKTAHAGIPASSFFDAAEVSGFRKEDFASLLDTSLKTFDRHKKENKKLNPQKSEYILKFIALFKKGEEVFGVLSEFRQWIRKPSFGLGGIVPYDLLPTTGGIDLIMDELNRISHGDLA